MSNTDIIIEERSRDIGDFLVGRLIPFRKKRMVGPFIFIDHMGPSEMGNGKYLDVDQHPHIGLSTLTYMLSGQIMHEDSIGTKQLITPGSVNWMTAGKGVTHTERTPIALRNEETHVMHGYQIWVALPKELEKIAPSFVHIPAKDLPSWNEGNTKFTLIAGKGFGRESPVPVYSPLFMVEIITSDTYELDISGALYGEVGICIVEGAVEACDQKIEKGNMLVSKVANQCHLKVKANSHLILFGGEPFKEERFIDWNFVASDQSTLDAAKDAWINHEFPKMKHDDSYVPLPSYQQRKK